MDQRDQAIATYQTAIAAQPSDPNLRFNLAGALFSKEDFRGAADSYREAIKLKPDFAHAYYNLGMSRLRLNDTAGARSAFDQARDLDPSLKPPGGSK